MLASKGLRIAGNAIGRFGGDFQGDGANIPPDPGLLRYKAGLIDKKKEPAA
jgi:hypothetical protein